MKKLKKYKIFYITIFIILIIIFHSIIKKYNKSSLIINGENFLYDKSVIYIDGAVVSPGIYEFSRNETIGNIIEKAEGLTEGADISNVDIEKVVKSGEKIIIPYLKSDRNVEKIEANLININTADKSKLMTLPGIGEKTANKIIEYRLNNRFKSIDDIMNVEGIGISKFSNIKDKIVVE